MTDTAPSPADVVRAVPEGQVVYGMQLPIQSQSTLYVADWEKESGPDELARIARVADEAGFFYLGVCDHTAIPRRLADAMGTIWYDTTATLGWLAAVTTRTHLLSHVLILAQRHPLPGRQGAVDHRPALGWAPHRGRGRGPRARGVRAVDRWLRRAGPPHRRGRRRAGPLLHRRVPRAPRAALPGARHGPGPAPGAPAPAAHLDRWLLAGRHPPHRGVRRRVAAPGDPAPRPARPDRPAARAAGRAARRGAASTSAPSSSRST